uniref:Uncharacterized protein n=1 Tax=Gasterosteus aculeatus aculeatus TaxID=481459 RepID=A0AAQ4NVZ7_GASAC
KCTLWKKNNASLPARTQLISQHLHWLASSLTWWTSIMCAMGQMPGKTGFQFWLNDFALDSSLKLTQCETSANMYFSETLQYISHFMNIKHKDKIITQDFFQQVPARLASTMSTSITGASRASHAGFTQTEQPFFCIMDNFASHVLVSVADTVQSMRSVGEFMKASHLTSHSICCA